MKWLLMLLLTILFAAQATNQDSIQTVQNPANVDLDVFAHHAQIHLITDMDSSFAQISSSLLHQFRQRYTIDDNCPSVLPLDLPMLKSQVLTAAESLIGDKLSTAYNSFGTRASMNRHIQDITIHICPDLSHWCFKENEEAFHSYFDIYIRHHWHTFVRQMQNHVPGIFEAARLQAAQVLDHFFDKCLQIRADNNTSLHWLEDIRPTTPFVFHTI